MDQAKSTIAQADGTEFINPAEIKIQMIPSTILFTYSDFSKHLKIYSILHKSMISPNLLPYLVSLQTNHTNTYYYVEFLKPNLIRLTSLF